MSETVPLCVIGGGSIGMRHIECALASDRVTLTAVVEAHAPQAARLAAQGLPVLANLSEVPDQTRAAIIATPTPDHAQTALACLERGWAVLAEKPLTQTLADAVMLCDRAEALGLPLFTGHHRRCHPFVAEARRCLSDIGPLVTAQGVWSLRKHDSYYDLPWRRTAGAGPILTNLSHEVDLLECLCGPIIEVTAMVANATRGLSVEDTTALTLRFESGALGSFIMSDAGASPWAFEAATGENPAIAVRGDDPLRLIGTQGALSFPSLTMWQGKDWQVSMTQTLGPDLPRVDGIAAQLDRFVAVVDGATDDLLATGRDGLRAMMVLDAVARAAQTGQTCQVAA